MRGLIYKTLFKKLGRHPLIWHNVYITHCFNIQAGQYFAINWGTHIDGRGGIEIGDHVLIGPNVFIGSSNHAIVPRAGQPRIFLGHEPAPVKIGNNVWIGANTVICPGVTIGDDSVIAAGSVVNANLPSAVLAAGNPAVVKRPLSGQ